MVCRPQSLSNGSRLMNPRALSQKIWDDHLVAERPGAPALIYVDLHLLHELTSPQAFDGLRRRGLRVRRPDLTVATTDHTIPTSPRGLPMVDRVAAAGRGAGENCREFGVTCYGLRATVKVSCMYRPELGLTQPGMTVVCGDSHTSTHGALGALAFGVGTSEVQHVLASQSLLQAPLKSFAVHVDGALEPGVTAKDIILALVAKIGFGGATGYVIEYRGSAIRSLSMDGRMTVCNMSIEAGAKAGLVAPDDTAFEYVAGRPFAPVNGAWDAALARWRTLSTDDGASYDRELTIDASRLEPMITFGTNPGMGIPISAAVPDPSDVADPLERETLAKALRYGPSRRQATAGTSGQRRLHRELHQLTHVGSARRRPS